jgi:hypothetical protein
MTPTQCFCDQQDNRHLGCQYLAWFDVCVREILETKRVRSQRRASQIYAEILGVFSEKPASLASLAVGRGVPFGERAQKIYYSLKDTVTRRLRDPLLSQNLKQYDDLRKWLSLNGRDTDSPEVAQENSSRAPSTNSEADEDVSTDSGWVERLAHQLHCLGLKITTKDFQQSCDSISRGRIFFRSRTGHVGFAPQATRRGDVLCVFPGYTVPFVIRPAERRIQYKLIGACYVHGLMKGKTGRLSRKLTETITII